MMAKIRYFYHFCSASDMAAGFQLGTNGDCSTKCTIASVLEKASFYPSHQLPAAPGFKLSNLGSLDHSPKGQLMAAW
jgi:hypothetical protein